MEMESDQMVEDNAKSGKRKRSPDTEPHTPTDWKPQDPQDQSGDVARKDNVKATPKRLRVETRVPDQELHPTGTFTLDYAHSILLSSLPVEILEHILSFTDPFALGRLMCTSKYFRDLLDPNQEHPNSSGIKTRLPLLVADSIWMCSREIHLPSVPHPLKSMTELDMFRLIYGRCCQKCGKIPGTSTSKLPPPRLWNSGPGPFGVRAIWPFKIKTCVDCLKPLLMKETHLTPSWLAQLRTALLSASFTPSLHYVMSVTLPQASSAGLRLTKYYYRPQVEEILRDAPDESDLESAAHTSWRDALDVTGQEAITDALRLEAWEFSQTATDDRPAVPFNVTSRSSASGSSVHSDNHTMSYFTTSSGGNRHFPPVSNRSGAGSSTMSSALARQGFGFHKPQLRTESIHGDRTHRPSSISGLPSLQVNTSAGPSQSRSDQSSLDIIRLKADKRREIEQRCQALVPPILPSVLEKLPAFDAALEGLMPLDEASWATLENRLLGQKQMLDKLDKRARDTVQHSDPPDNSTVWRATTPVAELAEEDPLDQAFRPVKEKLLGFAREYVYRHYTGGTGLTNSSAPQFAADVLLYVRDRFYQNQQQEDAAFAAQGLQPPAEGTNVHRARILKLEHMRYIFETSVKPYTEFVRKDLFLCSACDTPERFFGFEAIIQHFAAKHTDAFSLGRAVVNWQAEWPVQSPFEPAPGRYPDSATSVPYQSSASQVAAIGELSRAADFVLDTSSSGRYVDNTRGDLVPLPGYWPGTPARRGSMYATEHHGGESSLPTTYVPAHGIDRPRQIRDDSQSRERTALTNHPSTGRHHSDTGRHARSAEHDYNYPTVRQPYSQRLQEQSQEHIDTFMHGSGPQRGLYAGHGQQYFTAEDRIRGGRQSELTSPQSSVQGPPYYSRDFSSRDPLNHPSRPTEVLNMREQSSVDQRNPGNRLRLVEYRDYAAPPSRREAQQDYMPVAQQGASPAHVSGLAHDAARFLETINVSENYDQDKNLIRPDLVDRYSRPLSIDEVEMREASINRRPNISQPRSYIRISSGFEDEHSSVPVTASAENYNTLRRTDNWAHPNDRYTRGTYANYLSNTHISEQAEPGHTAPRPVVYTSSYERLDFPSDETRFRDWRYEPPTYQDLDQYRREVDPRNIGRVYQPIHDQESTSERPYYASQSRHAEFHYENPRREPGYDVERGAYHDTRTEREHYVYGQAPIQEVAYAEDVRPSQLGPSRPPIDDRRYNRR